MHIDTLDQDGHWITINRFNTVKTNAMEMAIHEVPGSFPFLGHEITLTNVNKSQEICHMSINGLTGLSSFNFC